MIRNIAIDYLELIHFSLKSKRLTISEAQKHINNVDLLLGTITAEERKLLEKMDIEDKKLDQLFGQINNAQKR